MNESSRGRPLVDPVLEACGISHGFGQRGSVAPETTLFPRQVHGVDVLVVGEDDGARVPQTAADAIVTAAAGRSVGIVTADCVPILAATEDGSAVAAIHAGWRGLAAGVVEAGLDALRRSAPGLEIVAAVGPAARGCCYEVDEPVRSGLAARYAPLLETWLEPGRAGRFQLDLAGLASAIVELNGVKKHRIGVRNRVCTICDGARFESFRRDGARAERLRHFMTRSATIPRSG